MYSKHLQQLAEVCLPLRVFNNPKDEYDSSTSRLSIRLCIIPGVPIHRYPIGGGLCVYVLLYLDFLQGEECRR